MLPTYFLKSRRADIKILGGTNDREVERGLDHLQRDLLPCHGSMSYVYRLVRGPDVQSSLVLRLPQ